MPSWPWTFATLPAGNVAASKLDDNFNAAMFAAGSSIDGAVPTWTGTGGNAFSSGGIPLGVGPSYIPLLTADSWLPAATGASQSLLACDSSATISYSFNVASAVKTATGTYEVTFIDAAPSASFIAVATTESGGPGLHAFIISKTASKVTVGTDNTVTQTLQDGGFNLTCFW